MRHSNKIRFGVWLGFAAVIACTTVVVINAGDRTASSNFAAAPTAYLLRPPEECPAQRYLTENELYEQSRLMDLYIAGFPEPEPAPELDPEDPLKGAREGFSRSYTASADVPAGYSDPDYPPGREYGAAIDPDGDHCQNPIPDELMMVDWSKLGPGSTTTSTTIPTVTAGGW